MLFDIIYEESLVGEEEELGHHHAQAEAGDGVAENHQCVLAQGEWRRNHVLVDLSIFVTMSSNAGSFSFTLSVPGQDTQSHFCTAPLYRVITSYHLFSLQNRQRLSLPYFYFCFSC